METYYRVIEKTESHFNRIGKLVDTQTSTKGRSILILEFTGGSSKGFFENEVEKQ